MRLPPTAAPALQTTRFPQYLMLREKISEWKTIGADPALLSAIQHGVRLCLSDLPFSPPNARERNSVEAVGELEKWVEEGAVRVLTKVEKARTRFWTPIFTVPKSSGGLRLITDLRNLNAKLTVDRWRGDTFETILSVCHLNPALCWGATLDMRSWFHNLALHPSARRWARVKVGSVAYEMQALPFGLSASPLWSHKMATPIVAWLREQGHNIFWYVDDVLVLAASEEEALVSVTRVLQLLERLGVWVNLKKSAPTPSQTVLFLGMTLNLRSREVYPTPARRATFCLQLKELRRSRTCFLHAVEKFGGLMNWMERGWPALKGFSRVLARLTAQLIRSSGRFSRVRSPPDLQRLLYLVYSATADETPATLFSPRGPVGSGNGRLRFYVGRGPHFSGRGGFYCPRGVLATRGCPSHYLEGDGGGSPVPPAPLAQAAFGGRH